MSDSFFNALQGLMSDLEDNMPGLFQNRSDTWEWQYLDLIKEILEEGDDREDRTGTGTRALFGKTLDIDLTKGFPAVTTKKLAWKSVVSELLWFLEGSGDERRLAEILHGTRDESKKTIWTDNANADYWKSKADFAGDLGRVYGVQWRDWKRYVQISPGGLPMEKDARYVEATSVDQLAELINKLKTNPTDRRMIISAWNPGELDQMALPPCHMLAQFFVSSMSQDEMNAAYYAYRAERRQLDVESVVELDAKYEGKRKTKEILKELGIPTGGKLSCQMYQRSVDTMLGLPFNIASYALLTHMLAQVSGLTVGRLIMNLGDVHIYKNHLAGAEEQLKRVPLDVPTLSLNLGHTKIEQFTMNDIALDNYQSLEAIKLDMAV